MHEELRGDRGSGQNDSRSCSRSLVNRTIRKHTVASVECFGEGGLAMDRWIQPPSSNEQPNGSTTAQQQRDFYCSISKS